MSNSKVIVLWISKHNPLKCEVEELNRLLGNYKLVIYPHQVMKVEFIYKNYIKPYLDKGYRVIVVPVLPLWMIYKLVQLGKEFGFEVWFAEMEPVLEVPVGQDVPYDPDCEVIQRTVTEDGREAIRVSRFKRFRKIKDIVFVYEDLDK